VAAPHRLAGRRAVTAAPMRLVARGSLRVADHRARTQVGRPGPQAGTGTGLQLREPFTRLRASLQAWVEVTDHLRHTR
jgi:hypothetical protein